jgi:hypothetical protein
MRKERKRPDIRISCGKRFIKTSSLFGLFKGELEDSYGIHIQFDGKTLIISKTHTDDSDYGISSYTKFAEYDEHTKIVEININTLNKL